METIMSTKERIVYESLLLFSQKGYDGVSMREIAAAVGIKGASIYNHFSGKEEILNAIFDEMNQKYNNTATLLSIPPNNNTDTARSYLHIDVSELLTLATGLFTFFATDCFAVQFRKLLICEQYKNEVAAQRLKAYYFTGPIEFNTLLFSHMQEQGGFQGLDTEVLALHFYSPIYFLLMQLDTGEKFDHCTELLKKHIYGFHKAYCLE